MLFNKSRTLMLGLLLVLSSPVSFSADIERVATIQDSSAVSAGEEITVSLYIYNNSPSTKYVDDVVSSTLPMTINTESQSSNVVGKLIPEIRQSKLKGNSFIKVNYTVTLPKQIERSIQIDIPDTSNSSLFLYVSKPETQPKSAPSQANKHEKKVYQDAFSPYKPMYFLLGVNDGLEDSSFQFSFSYRIFNGTGAITSNHPWMAGFHLGFTQKSLWDLESESKPFEDTSYMPEFYYRFNDISLGWPGNSTLQLQLGLLHESNGQEGDQSRSTNYAYMQPEISLPLIDDYELQLSHTMWAYVRNDNETNPDLKYYKGYMEFEAKVISLDGIAISTSVRPANKGTSFELDVSYPLSHMFGKNLDLYAYAKYFNGYSETLLNYSEKEETLRIGFAVVR
ncbi:phospholipase A [Vibrio comitans]|uniref:Phospholipase A1 n=1 Tax=Vibrio comitans NBRC 102076 TaxID=1219078 RepID=A0A4Y3IJD4_9VIBR|nr:phospholipase A [Vibrio comitans]GEA58850.1 hypothetical protein VCO01S_00430 [Vibrio comitans NBRC 102076]